MSKSVRKRVVVTGIGAVCNLGVNATEIWDNLLGGEIPFRHMTTDDDPDYAELTYTIGAPVPTKFKAESYYAKYPNSRYRSAAYGLAAAEEAIADSGYTCTTDEERRRTGVYFSAANFSFSTLPNRMRHVQNKSSSPEMEDLSRLHHCWLI